MKKLPQVVILAAGESSRMFPFTDFPSHKSMIEIGGRPILWYTLKAIKKSGLKDVTIVINKDNTDIPAYFKNGKEVDLSIRYVTQKRPRGMGDAVLSTKEHLQDTFIIINPNHINCSEFLPSFLRAFTSKYGGVLLGNETKEPWRCGIFRLKGNKILEIVEKPAQGKEPSDIRVVGLYLLQRDFLQVLAKTPRSPYQFEAALNKFFKKRQVRLLITNKETFSLKYAWDLLRIKEFLASKMKLSISRKAVVSPRAVIHGKVIIEEGARIFEEAILKGPVYVGKHAVIGNHTLIRENTFLEEGARIGAMTEVRNSLFMKNSSFHSGFVGDSIIGENTRIGAGFITANKRFDRGEISVHLEKEKIPTGRTSLGTIIGHHVSIGIKSGAMPGIIIGSHSIIYPGTMVYKNVPENAIIGKKVYGKSKS